ncbi:MAG: hypothetical protein NVSMB19_13950 [Vulcanimicrobiaceae bacterium]
MARDERMESAAAERVHIGDGAEDDAAQIRYSLTALGEAVVTERARARFHGFGPCPVALLNAAG